MFEIFRQNVKTLLKTKRITYSQLAKQSLIAESTIKAFMCGASDSRRVAEKIANCLGCAIQYESGRYLLINKEDK